jgi:hypothetical protein
MSTFADRTLASGVESRQEWSPARVFLVAAGVYLLVVGIAGFLIDRSFPVGSGEALHSGSADIFGIFKTNGWHSLSAVLFGALAIAFAIKPETARAGALVVGVPNALVLFAFLIEDPRTFWFASNGADQVAHALLGFGGIAAALLTRKPNVSTGARA